MSAMQAGVHGLHRHAARAHALYVRSTRSYLARVPPRRQHEEFGGTIEFVTKQVARLPPSRSGRYPRTRFPPRGRCTTRTSKPTRCSRTRARKASATTIPTTRRAGERTKSRDKGRLTTRCPPVAGVIGRATGAVAIEVVPNADRASLLPFIEMTTQRDATIYTDEAGA